MAKYNVGDKVLVGRKKEPATITKLDAGFGNKKGGYMVNFKAGGSASVSESEVFPMSANDSISERAQAASDAWNGRVTDENIAAAEASIKAEYRKKIETLKARGAKTYQEKMAQKNMENKLIEEQNEKLKKVRASAKDASLDLYIIQFSMPNNATGHGTLTRYDKIAASSENEAKMKWEKDKLDGAKLVSVKKSTYGK